MKQLIQRMAWCLVITSFCTFSQAGVIDFESTATGSTPDDNSLIGLNEWFKAGGVFVRFGFDSDHDGVIDQSAVFEQANNTDNGGDTGFWGTSGAKDVAASGYQSLLGNFFLRQSKPYKPFGVFTILYDSIHPVTAASGEIWDIDGRKTKTEQFLVQAFNGETLLASLTSPLGNNKKLNGKPWTFGFSGLSDITKLEITFIGSKTKGIGLAFNNFSPVEDISQASRYVPEPESIILFIAGILGIASSVFDKRFFRAIRYILKLK
ncbi:hypothetical protein EYS14_12620 [Alteromonadaceae bacterium M269]|nr:hypothetical protein EYS14_12620 [Alteromonadaceae bacterium M269]